MLITWRGHSIDWGQRTVVASVVVLVLLVASLVDMSTPEPVLRSSAADVSEAGVPTSADGASGRRWISGSTVTFAVNPAGAPVGAVEAIASAAASWAVSGVDVELRMDGHTEASGVTADSVNVVSWVDPDEGDDAFVGRTVVHWHPDRPDVIVGFDMVFSTAQGFSVGAEVESFDVETVALHEFGHVLGLGHVPAERVLQVMRPGVEAGEQRRRLSLADLESLRALYGVVVDEPRAGLFDSSTARRVTTAAGGLFE